MSTYTLCRRMVLKCLLIGLTCLGAAGLSWADRYVATNGTGNGSSWANATNSIQDAIDAAASPETVWVSNGVYIAAGTVVGGVTNMVYIYKGITLRSTNGPAVTLLNGEGLKRVLYVAHTNAVVDGFTILARGRKGAQNEAMRR